MFDSTTEVLVFIIGHWECCSRTRILDHSSSRSMKDFSHSIVIHFDVYSSAKKNR